MPYVLLKQRQIHAYFYKIRVRSIANDEFSQFVWNDEFAVHANNTPLLNPIIKIAMEISRTYESTLYIVLYHH